MIASLRFFLIMLVITVLLSVALFLFPQIDVAISGLFYGPDHTFLLANHYQAWHLELYRNLLVWITYAFIAVIAMMFFIGVFSKKIKPPISPKNCLFVMLCFLIIPFFIVNYVFKDHWGRARPSQVQQFGGDKTFSQPWVISNQCTTNCSFPSGEVANIFCYLSLLFIVRRQRLAATLILTVGALIAFERIAQGRHFFSDAVISGLLSYLLSWLIYHALNVSLSLSSRGNILKFKPN